jgi:hypothetical protein
LATNDREVGVSAIKRSGRPRRIPAAWALLGTAALLSIVGLTPFGGPSQAVSQVAPPPAAGVADPDAGAFPVPAGFGQEDLSKQTAEMAEQKSFGCVQCHHGAHDPHGKTTVRLGCVDCHGGDPTTADRGRAHVWPQHPDAWRTSANPVRTYTLLNHESPAVVRFVNPGDLRIAHLSCGTVNCHPSEVLQSKMSMMTHGAMLWGAALYNNGSYPLKQARFGESYSMFGTPQRLQTVPPPSDWEIKVKGVVPYLDPLPHFEASQPGNILRIFELGGRLAADTAIPNAFETNGKPGAKLSVRGLGTQNRTDPVFIGLTKTRLLDPTLNFLGTNDHPGDYRSSGCTACHVIYANDRSPVHSGPYAALGNLGMSRNPDPTIPKDEPGHPIDHKFTTGIPSSQCIVCHVHPGTNVMNSYLGYTWWDEETDGELMYPADQRHPTSEEYTQSQLSNPDETAAKGLWSNPRFLEHVAELNPQARHTQFADFHGHGWVFRAVFKKDRKGNLVDHEGRMVGPDTTHGMMAAIAMPSYLKEQHRTAAPGARPAALPNRDGVPVHLLDIHLEKGMHCVDCHFVQDVHGNTRLQQEVRAAIEIQCIDCHGTADRRANLLTSGPAAYTSGAPGGPPGRNLAALRTPSGKRRFERQGKKLVQNSMVEPNLAWEVVQTVDTIDPASEHYNEKSHLAKTARFDSSGQIVWGSLPPGGESACAHSSKNMTCIACHSSWNPSCFGCHLPQKANKKMPALHNEGEISRNYVSYNFQTLRDDVFMLARDGDVTGNRIGPARSSCAIHVGSYNTLREAIYVQQQTVSAEGLSGVAFSTNVPHTVRGGPTLTKGGPNHGRPISQDAYLPGRNETKQCTDCHLSRNEDNNAVMAQLLMHGTNYTNFIGRFCWVAAGEHGLAAVIVTEREEPQAVIGSALHRLAFPDDFRKHVEHGGMLKHAHEHPGRDISEALSLHHRKPEVLDVQARGEFLYAACGENGLRVFDIAFIDHKGFSERIVTAPVSPMGQRFFVRTRNARAVAAPTTAAPDPTRTHRDENREAKVHAIYGYLYVADSEEGLITVPAATIIDGNPVNNFLEREVTFNPGNVLHGARSITIVGTLAYICCDAGLVVVDLDDPKNPQITSIVGPEILSHPRSAQVQFRYCYVCDEGGIKVFDVTDLAHPRRVSRLDLPEAHSIYLARTYAYVAAGSQGLVILDIENPVFPRVDQVFNAGGCINDVHDVKLGITYSSEFAYLADGINGLRVVQLTSPDTPGNMGFSPRPTPQLVATYKLPQEGHVLAVSEGLDRDRAVDEAGNQIGVFGRIGARPLSLEEQRRLYLRGLQPWKVSDDPRDPLYRRVGPGRAAQAAAARPKGGPPTSRR